MKEQPGEYPYTRGISAEPRVWTMGQYGGFGTPAETNAATAPIKLQTKSNGASKIKSRYFILGLLPLVYEMVLCKDIFLQ